MFKKKNKASYKVGSYVYNSKNDYEKMILGLLLLFIAAQVILYLYKSNLDLMIYVITSMISGLMVLHLILRFVISRRIGKEITEENLEKEEQDNLNEVQE